MASKIAIHTLLSSVYYNKKLQFIVLVLQSRCNTKHQLTGPSSPIPIYAILVDNQHQRT